MARAKIIPAAADHIPHLAAHVRPADRDEFAAQAVSGNVRLERLAQGRGEVVKQQAREVGIVGNRAFQQIL